MRTPPPERKRSYSRKISRKPSNLLEELPNPSLIKEVISAVGSKKDLHMDSISGSYYHYANPSVNMREKYMIIFSCILVMLMNNFVYGLQAPFLPGLCYDKGLKPQFVGYIFGTMPAF